MRRLNFVPLNLTIARNAMGITMSSLAKRINITPSAISQFEKGITTPSADTVFELAKQLHKPFSFFFTERKRDYEIKSPITYRSLNTTLAHNRAASREKSFFVAELLEYIFLFLQEPEVVLPNIDLDEPWELTKKDIDLLATKLRDYWNLKSGPISNLCYLLENKGIICTNLILPKKIDSFSFYIQYPVEAQSRPLILNDTRRNFFRSRFNLAHELGHILMHKYVSDEDYEVYHKKIESDAMYFAGAFLLPYNSFPSEVFSTTLNGLANLKKRWNVSIAAIVRRIYDLGIIDSKRYRYLNIEISRKGWNKKEIYDDTAEIEKPYYIREALKYLFNEKKTTPQEIVNTLCLNPEELEEISGFNYFFVEEKKDNIFVFNPK